MSPDQLVALVVGALLPSLVAVVVRSTWPSWLKGLLAVVSSVVVGSITAWVTGQLTSVAGWVEAVVIVGGASMATYKLWWQPSGIGPAIEHATEPGKVAPVRTRRAVEP